MNPRRSAVAAGSSAAMHASPRGAAAGAGTASDRAPHADRLQRLSEQDFLFEVEAKVAAMSLAGSAILARQKAFDVCFRLKRKLCDNVHIERSDSPSDPP
jgi:hypothetical protein